MTLIQLFLGVLAALVGAGAFVILYFDAKFDPLKEQIRLLVAYMIQHEGRIVTLDEKLKKAEAKK